MFKMFRRIQMLSFQRHSVLHAPRILEHDLHARVGYFAKGIQSFVCVLLMLLE